MSKHDETATEQLSAYLDGELSAGEAATVEARLAGDPAARQRLDGLRRVVEGLHQSDPPPLPPPTLHHAVARRIALERQRVPFLDRFETSLSPLGRHNPLLPMFAVIVALALAVYFLSVLFERAARDDVAVVVVGAEAGSIVLGSRLEIADRVLFWEGDKWRQRGTPAAPARSVALGSAAMDALLSADPSLGALTDLGAPALVWSGGEAVLVQPAADSP